MTLPDVERRWTRRARPLLGTLVEVGVHGTGASAQADQAIALSANATKERRILATEGPRIS